jgi:hypothetical protein
MSSIPFILPEYINALTRNLIVQRDSDYLSSHAFFVGLIAKAFETFVESTERDCLGK